MIIAALFYLGLATMTKEEPLIKTVKYDDEVTNDLLKNGGFDLVSDDRIAFWRPWKNGYEVVEDTERGGIVAHCMSIGGESGIAQSLRLDQSSPQPLIISGWSKARDVTGGRDSGYSIYVDIIYQDGTPLWGQVAKFSTGTHGWERQELIIVPEKPIRDLTIYGLFRGHLGEVWFDDFRLYQLGSGGTMFLDGVPILPPERQIGRPNESRSITRVTSDGLSLAYDRSRGMITSIRLDDVEIASDSPSGFIARDVAADSDYFGFLDGESSILGLNLEFEITANGNHLAVSGTVADTTGKDRAVNLMFALPIDADGWTWYDDIRHAREIEETGEYFNSVNMHTGTNGLLSRYPFACIANRELGLAIGIDMNSPAQYRLIYNSTTSQFLISYDFGLTRETANFPGSAPFRFIIYRIDPAWGFRSAADRFYRIFPEQFVCRSKKQGIWMPFTDVSTVEGWQDFGFRYHEGINNVPFDDQADILSFRYTEPATWWMKMDSGIERSHENVMKQLHESAASGNKKAKSILISGTFDEHGRYQYLIRNTPWCDGAVFSSNPSPYIPGESEARLNWNDELKERLYGNEAKGEQDGEYLDSLEGYVTAEENFRREHFRHVTVPLTFSTVSRKPVIHKSFSIYEFTKWIAEDVHRMGKLMFANAVPYRFSFLCPHLDIMGTETNWITGDGKWRPDSDENMNFRRTMCYQKPYLFLMNTNYDLFTPDLVEKYFQRCLFYGMFPSMFSPTASSQQAYWRTPAYYNRDRHLFRRYIPIIKEVAESGWEPITLAHTDDDSIYVERFGPNAQGYSYFTLMNQSDRPTRCRLTIEFDEISEAEEITSGRNLRVKHADEGAEVEIDLEAEQVAVVRVRASQNKR